MRLKEIVDRLASLDHENDSAWSFELLAQLLDAMTADQALVLAATSRGADSLILPATVNKVDDTRQLVRRHLAEHRQLIADARSQADDVLAEARRQGDAQRDRVKAEAGADLERRLEENNKTIEAENRKLLEQVRREVVELTLIAAEKVTGKTLDADDQRRLIDEAVGELDFDRIARSN